MNLTLIRPKQYYKEFKQLLLFVRNPMHNIPHTFTASQKIKGTWKMFVVKFVLAIIVGVGVGVFYDAENMTKGSMATRFSLPVLFLITVLILPLLEEVAFRLSLKFKPVFLALTLGVLAYYLVSKAVYQTKLSDVYEHFTQRVFIALAVFGICYALSSIPKAKHHLGLFWTRNYKWIFYFFCLVFAWIHIFNYELHLTHLLLMPIITLDKLVSALCYGYTRVTYGFIYSLAIHMLNNSIGYLVMVISGVA